MAGVNQENYYIRNVEKFISTTIAEKEGFKNFKLQTTPTSTDGANYMGDLFLVDLIEDGKETLNLFAKVANTPENVRAVVPANKVYRHETFVYTTVSETFHELQERHGVPEEKRFKFPKHYGSNLKEMEEVLVLENLTAQGFILYDRFKPIDWEYAKAAVEEIAKFHALSFALKKENPKLFKEITEAMPNFLSEESMKQIMESSKKLLPLAVNVIEEENKIRLQKYIDENIDKFLVKRFEPISKYSIIIHADYRASNILVKYQGDKVVSLIPVDYQTTLHGNPLNDIIYILFAGSDEEFRRKYFDDYLEHYYNCLARQLKLLSHDIKYIYPRSAFYFELKDSLKYGLEVALFTLNAVLVDPKKVVTVETMVNPEMSEQIAESFKPSDVYVERLNGIVRDFARWGYFDENSKPMKA